MNTSIQLEVASHFLSRYRQTVVHSFCSHCFHNLVRTLHTHTHIYSLSLTLFQCLSIPFRLLQIVAAHFRCLVNPAARRAARSPSPSHRLAFTSWTTLIICFPNITGKLTPANTQGQNESILFARASSSAPALQGLANRERADTCDGFPGCSEPGTSDVCNREGDKSGDEKESRYSAIKNVSLRVQKRKSTV